MKGLKITAVTLVLAVLLVGAKAATGAEKNAPKGLKELGFRVYWSLLTTDQREEAKEIAVDYLADTAPDRLAALGRLIRYKADVARVLTKDQRIEAGKMKAAFKRLSKEKRKEYVQRLLSEMDRPAVADRVEQAVSAGPEEKVRLGLEIIDMAFETLIGKIETRLELSAEQVAAIRDHYDTLKTDLEPVAVRIETAKQKAIRDGIAILDESQKEKLTEVRNVVLDRVLQFIHGE